MLQISPLLRQEHARVALADLRPRLAKIYAFCKNAFRGPGIRIAVSAALSRRKAVSKAPCKKWRRMELILGQQEPLRHFASSPRARSQHTSWPGRGASTAACCVGHSIHISSPRPLCATVGAALEAIVASPVASGPA